MPNRTRRSTANVKAGQFQVHGAMDIEVSGVFNVLVATGPFNLELVRAAESAQTQLDPELCAKGRWGTLLIFRHSAMTSLDALEEITRVLQKRVSVGMNPAAVAMVFGPDVEGSGLMNGHYIRAYAAAGIPGKAFDNVDEARVWLASYIESAG